MFLATREFFRHTTCWNCKVKKSCRSYQSIKFDGAVSITCADKNRCRYCDTDKSFGNLTLYSEEGLDLFIAGKLLYSMRKDNNTSYKVRIYYCPMCGHKI